MNTVPKELAKLLKRSEFKKFHSRCDDKIYNHLERFLSSTMDEVRLTTSNRAVLDILETIGLKDFGAFRDAVLRRELSGMIAYEKQRDHSSHTLYNYLLGWFFFVHSEKLKSALASEFGKRGIPNKIGDAFKDGSTYFGCIWQYVSLLHDIGYMFEGNVTRMSFEESSKQAEIGARVARNYFNRAVWTDYEIDLAATRSQLFEHLGTKLRPPPFNRTNTLGDIADELRTIGNLDGLLPHVSAELGGISVPYPVIADFSGDAFDLWSHYYEQFGSAEMAKRFKSLRKIFNGLIDIGLPGINVRVLDHGVCGGLLQLGAATYYYRLRAAALGCKVPRPLLAQRVLESGDWSPAFWWTAIVWGTAATALHNVQQMSAAATLDPDWPGKLRLSDDPLAYLGILVDVIQEWNRYSVFKALDREPIQGIEVELGAKAGQILLRFREPNAVQRAEKVRKELDQALENWGDLLEVQA